MMTWEGKLAREQTTRGCDATKTTVRGGVGGVSSSASATQVRWLIPHGLKKLYRKRNAGWHVHEKRKRVVSMAGDQDMRWRVDLSSVWNGSCTMVTWPLARFFTDQGRFNLVSTSSSLHQTCNWLSDGICQLISEVDSITVWWDSSQLLLQTSFFLMGKMVRCTSLPQTCDWPSDSIHQLISGVGLITLWWDGLWLLQMRFFRQVNGEMRGI